jgi:hypothetical protein
MFILEGSFEHQYLFATPVTMAREAGLGLPSHKGNRFIFGIMKRQNTQPSRRPRQKLGLARIDSKLSCIVSIKLAQFDKNRTTVTAKGAMARADRISHIRARPIMTIFIRKDAVKDQELLASGVFVLRKV